MDVVAWPGRDAVLALLDGAIRVEARQEIPPGVERRDWIRGGVEPTRFTEPDEHGWFAPIRTQAEMWLPRALVFWRVAIASGAPIKRAWMRELRHSLTRWPAIEVAVGDYLLEHTPA